MSAAATNGGQPSLQPAAPPLAPPSLVHGRLSHLEPIGVIDIGSNSVRLVVYEGLTRSPTPLFNEKILCGLGKSIASRGRLGTEAKERALQALSRFKTIAGILNVRDVRVLATAAVREATDGPEFIALAEQACGVKLTVLTGQQEAEYAAAGILMGFADPDGLAGDLGGGSLELIDIKKRTLAGAMTLPLGGLRLMDVSGGERDKAERIVEDTLKRAELLARGRGRPFYAVGGTWRAIARLHMAETNYPLRVTHGYRIKTSDAVDLCGKLAKGKKLATIKSVEDASGPRHKVIPFGAMVLEGLLKRIQPSELIISVFGIREGLLYQLLDPAEQDKDPLLAFCSDYARLRSRAPDHAQELCDWTDSLFAGQGPDETLEERRLRHAACILSDIGWRAHPDYRGEQSLNVIAHAALSGIDHPGRAFLALSVYFRHSGQVKDELGERLTGMVSKRAIKRARILGAAIRTAHMLSIGMAGVIRRTTLAYDGPKIVLGLPAALRPLDGERLRRRFTALADLLERPCEIRAID
jgi:exopolyphosphatase / guanosine-5'-triphosphate,3'-diphosphate pyrophosphatase